MLAELPEENNSNDLNDFNKLRNIGNSLNNLNNSNNWRNFGNENNVEDHSNNVEDHSMASLTLEQQFHYVTVCSTIDKMNLEQARNMLKEVYRQMLLKDNLYKHLLKKQWGLAP